MTHHSTGQRSRLLPWGLGGALLAGLTLCLCSLAITLSMSSSVSTFLFWQLQQQSNAGSLQVTPASSGFVVIANTPIPATPEPTPPLRISIPISEPEAVVESPSPTPAWNLLPTAIPAVHPMPAYTIDGLRVRPYPGGDIRVRQVLTATGVFTRYYIDYPSDDLTITGIMQIPEGAGPFPVIILNHGYIPRESYWSGADTVGAAAYLNRQGYLTLAPDFRSWGESDTGNSFFSTGQLIDALNLVSSLPSLPKADPARVGMWGHSMGGGVALKAITVDDRIKAAVLYAPVSANEAEVVQQWGPGCNPAQPFPLADKCGGAEILYHISDDLFYAYAETLANPHLMAQVSSINYFDYIDSPVQIHIGTADTSTPPQWSAAIYSALLEAGKKAEFYPYASQGHSFSGQAWQLYMQRTTAFFDQYVK